MTLLSAYEDFTTRTLDAFHDVWHKLQFVARLRKDSGRYQHWGMEQTFGPEKTQAAIARAHQEVALQLLETPLQRLHSDVRIETALDPNTLAPADWGGGAPEHLDYIVLALTLLSRSSAPAIDRVA